MGNTDRLFPLTMVLSFNVAAYLSVGTNKLIKAQNSKSNSLVRVISHIYAPHRLKHNAELALPSFYYILL